MLAKIYHKRVILYIEMPDWVIYYNYEVFENSYFKSLIFNDEFILVIISIKLNLK